MSETAGTVIKLLSALTSPKASVKYISVGIFIVLSWKHVQDYLSSSGLPKEQLSLVVLLIGVGLGSLIGQLIYMIIDYIWNRIGEEIATRKSKKEKEELREKKERSEQEKSDIFLSNFIKVFSHYPYWKKDELRKLTKGEQCLEWEYDHIRSLKSNDYIIKVSNVDRDRDIYKINPIIQEYVAAEWQEEVDKNMDAFFNDMTSEKETLLYVMEMEQYESNEPFHTDVIDALRPFHPCIMIEDENQFGLTLSFRFPYCSLFSERYGKDLADELHINDNRILGYE